MPTYEYCCSNVKCNYKCEEFQSMMDKKFTKCPVCRKQTFYRLISRGENIIAARVPLYDFVDHKTTTKPVRINSKRQWQEHLKKIGQVEASNTPPSVSSLESAERTRKMVAKRELKEAVVKSVKDKKHINEMKQKILKRGGV